jgi:MFS transporter, ACS family, hexuronate transporter
MAVPGMSDMSLEPSTTTAIAERQATLRAWSICGLMLMATMLNYMDRQALAQQATEICRDLTLSNQDYAGIESGFGLAFAIGGIVTGLIADRLSPRWLYPMVLMGWSAVGFATGWASNYRELLVCRILLGFFEAGQWPCALITSQRLLSRRDRPLGNSILQSGASLGAIATPFVVIALTTSAPDSWRLPFRVIGATGAVWVVAWLATVRSRDLDLQPELTSELGLDDERETGAARAADASLIDASNQRWIFIRRFLALAIVVVVINLCWQYFRAWMPKMLREQYQYSQSHVQYFSITYYIAADAGCLGVGLLIKWLTARGYSVPKARMATFLACVLLTGLSTLAAVLPASTFLLATLLLIGFGSLGQFPVYYALTQELSARRMGNITGMFSFIFWLSYALVSGPIGAWIDRTGSYSQVMFVAGLLPFAGLLALMALWTETKRRRPA